METLRRRFAALADETRLKILALLQLEEELCLCHLQDLLGLAASTLSRHVALLRDAGFLEARRQGKWVHFRLADSGKDALLALLLDMPELDSERRKLSRILQNHIETKGLAPCC